MRRTTEAGTTEYAVDPEEVASALAARLTFNTGLLSPDTLCVLVEGTQRTIAEYRRPQKTALWLEGTDDPLRVPLPGLVMVRKTAGNSTPSYSVWAATQRPASYDARLYHAPLPNVYGGGGVCWGTVKRVGDAALAGSSLAEDWQQLLGSRFGNHSVSGKSKEHRQDVRQMYFELEERNARVYPKKDLIDAKRTLGAVLGVKES